VYRETLPFFQPACRGMTIPSSQKIRVHSRPFAVELFLFSLVFRLAVAGALFHRFVIMRIIGIEGMSGEDLSYELQRGAKFVMYQYCISILILTFKRPTDIYFVKAGQSAVTKGLGFSVLTFFFGWWGFPWGPIYTIGSFVVNFRGGKDVTREVVHTLQQSAG
jgi:hypothetical protein